MTGTRGQINFRNPGNGIYGFNDFESDRYYDRRRQRNNRWVNDDWDDDRYFYFKKDGKVKKQKKLKSKISD